MFASFRRPSKHRKTSDITTKRPLLVEHLEDRYVLSTFSVINLANSGTGSFRQAILDANSNAGADQIDFDVAGTISLTSALPTITGEVDIDGTTAPNYAGDPVIQVDFNNTPGLRFNSAAAGSSVQALSLVDSSTAGVTITGGGDILLTGNFIGLALDGATAIANRGYGVDIVNSSGNTIGGTTDADRNVISGNRKDGIRLSGSSDNRVLGNYIGTDSSGEVDRGNLGSGVLITSISNGNLIGELEAGNVISGNNTNGVLINGRSRLNTVDGNIIGLTADGDSILGNSQDGVKVQSASDNQIGHADPVSSIDYYNTDDINTDGVDGLPIMGWEGIRAAETPGDYMIVGTAGTTDTQGLLYIGNMAGTNGQTYGVNYPDATSSSVYGPDLLEDGRIRLVGTYQTEDTSTVAENGFVFEGSVDDLGNRDNYRTINYPDAMYTYLHSTDGALVVGNYDNPASNGDAPIGPGHAFMYNLDTEEYTEITFPGAQNVTAYGVWHNEGTKYTIVGGYGLDPDNSHSPVEGKGYIVDYDSSTGEFTHWKSYAIGPGVNVATHFQGISSVETGVYTLACNSTVADTDDPLPGTVVSVRRNADGSFGDAVAVPLDASSVTSDTGNSITTSDAVYGNQVVGIVIGNTGIVCYQATLNINFQLSNVISGNGSDGIELSGASENHVAMNYIGTDITGTVDLGNTGNGILVTSSSTQNMIGGESTGGNAPTTGVFVRPPEGNLISGNNANGVLINGKSTSNQLSGNFIGTDESGNSALGNVLDGVAIVGANSNTLLGCTFQQDPFVFYNVIGGNGANGLRMTNSNDTTIQANFFGLGANNATRVGNLQNGVVVEGSSTRTTLGGPIPMGNVVSANEQNGVVVRGTASYFTSYNTFCGIAAFGDDTSFGNGLDGILITSTGGNIALRTNVVSENGDDGIEISGAAQGIHMPGNIIGLDTYGFTGMGNADNGIEIGGTAHDIVIGGAQPTFNVAPRNAIGDNGGNGIAIIGKAHNITVNHSVIGTNIFGDEAIGNGEAGILIDTGTYLNTIGSNDSNFLTIVSGNAGNGIEMRGTRNNSVLGTYIGVSESGDLPLGNGANGVLIVNSSGNFIGAPNTLQNIIAFNEGNGVFVESGNNNGIRENSIHTNALLGINLAPGANNNQAAPVLTSVQALTSNLQITGSLTSRPNTTYTVEFFANQTGGPEGRTYLGSKLVRTNSLGTVSFTALTSLPPSSANYITATATDSGLGFYPASQQQLYNVLMTIPGGLRRITSSNANGTANNTSEFSAPIAL